MDLFGRMFGKDSASKDIAKERLRLVLVHDRASVAPDLLDAMKEDIISVISKYVDIDVKGTEVHFENDKDSTALVASIPVLSIKRGIASKRG